MQRNHHIPPRSYSQSEPYPLVESEEARAAASFVSGQFRRVFYTYTVPAEQVKVTPSYVAGSMSLVDVLDYVTYSNGGVEAVKVTPSYVAGSMALTATVVYKTYADADVEAVKVTPGYVPGSMSLPTVVQYISYSNAEVEAVKVTPSYVSGSMTLLPNPNTTFEIPVAATVSGTHTDFPVYVKPSVIAGLGSLTLAEAQSSRFFADVGLTQELAREVVSADEIHVKAGSLDSNTVLYMAIDGQRPDYVDTDLFGAQAVWSNGYAAVWHMSEANVLDSTNNGITGASTGTTSTTAALGLGQFYSGGAYTDIGAPAILDFNNQSFTIDLWFNSTDSGTSRLVDNRGQGAIGGYPGYQISAHSLGGLRNTLVEDISGNHVGFQAFSGVTFPNDGADHKLAFRWDNSTGTLDVLIDGALVGSDTNPAMIGADLRTTRRLNLGRASTGAQYYTGILDEVTVSLTNLSDDWLATEYANQNDPSTFFGTATQV